MFDFFNHLFWSVESLFPYNLFLFLPAYLCIGIWHHKIKDNMYPAVELKTSNTYRRQEILGLVRYVHRNEFMDRVLIADLEFPNKSSKFIFNIIYILDGMARERGDYRGASDYAIILHGSESQPEVL